MRSDAGRLVGFLALGMTVLVLLLSFMRWQKSHSTPAILPIVPAASSLESLAVMAPIMNKKGSPDMLERPLFWKARGPYVPLPPSKGGPKPKPPTIGPDVFDQVKLLGTYVVGGKASLIVEGSEGPKRMKEGEELDGWLFESMGEEGAVFSQDGERRILVMQKPMPPTKEELEQQAAEIKARTEKRTAKAVAKLAEESGAKPEEQAVSVMPGMPVKAGSMMIPSPGLKGAPSQPSVEEEAAEENLSDFEKSYRRHKERAREMEAQRNN